MYVQIIKNIVVVIIKHQLKRKHKQQRVYDVINQPTTNEVFSDLRNFRTMSMLYYYKLDYHRTHKF
jgi:hypothetical protein